jgi:hypothetical protein
MGPKVPGVQEIAESRKRSFDRPGGARKRPTGGERIPGRGQEIQEGRQSRERPAHRPADRDSEAQAPACFGTPEPKCVRGDAATVASRRDGGTPWRNENPRRGSAPFVRPITAERSTDFRVGLKPLRARSTPTAHLRETDGPALRSGRRRARGSAARVSSDGRLERPSTTTPGGAGNAERCSGAWKERTSGGRTP